MHRIREWEDDDAWPEPTQADSASVERLAEELADCCDVGAADEVRHYEGYTTDTGQSWLANDVIIGSLSDHKLKTALSRYKSLVRLCEAELAARAVAPRRPTRSANRRVGMAGRASAKNSPVSTRSRKTKLALTPGQMLQALGLLLKLKQKDKTK